MSASLDDLQQINGIGPNIALSIRDWFERSANQELLIKFRQIGIWPQMLPIKASGKLAGLTIVITGTLPTLSREEAKSIIEKNGGKVTDNVSKNTNYLLLGDNPGSKFEKARQLNIPVIGEKELLDLIESRS